MSHKKYLNYVWLSFATVLFFFADGVNTIPLFTWFAPVFLLRFVRTHRPRIGLPLAFFVLSAAYAFQ